MAGYEATARIGRAAPRFLPAPPASDADDHAPATIEVGDVAVVDVGGEAGLGGRLGTVLTRVAELASDVREIWVHSRRVLSDPGWR